MAHNQTFTLYRKALSALRRDVFALRLDRMERAVRALIIGLPIWLYPALLFGTEDGKRTYTPHGVWEHIGLFVAEALIVYAALAGAAVLVVSAELGRSLPWVRFVLGMAGVQSARGIIRRAEVDLRQADLEYEVMCVEAAGSARVHAYTMGPVNNLRRFLDALALDDGDGEYRYTTAWWRTRRIARRARAAIERNTAVLDASATLESAISAIRSGITAPIGTDDDTSLVYYSIVGPLRNTAEMVFVRRHLVAGKDPFEQYEGYGGQRIVGEHWQYAALVCAPRWSHTARLGRGDTAVEPHERISGAAPARGTYRDTVRSLWRSEWWEMYHQPEKIVRAAKALDHRRCEHDATTYVA